MQEVREERHHGRSIQKDEEPQTLDGRQADAASYKARETSDMAADVGRAAMGLGGRRAAQINRDRQPRHESIQMLAQRAPIRQRIPLRACRKEREIKREENKKRNKKYS